MADVGDFFPDFTRVIYGISPLVEVICQVRFPTVLRIESQPPADFQEAIRGKYPLFEREMPQGLPANLPPEIASLIGAAAQSQINYRFTTEDGNHTVALSPASLSLTSTRYSRWEQYSEHLQTVLQALSDIYRPSFFSRIGLRYRNALIPDRLSLAGQPWSSMISENIIGELKAEDLGPGKITEAHRKVRLVSSDGDGVLLQHGLGRVGPKNETAYIIDMDCYTDQKTEVQNAQSVLGRFNVRARRGFRWCITSELHHALRPTELP